MKTRKAAKPNGITSELLIACKKLWRIKLAEMANDLLQWKEMPES